MMENMRFATSHVWTYSADILNTDKIFIGMTQDVVDVFTYAHQFGLVEADGKTCRRS